MRFRHLTLVLVAWLLMLSVPLHGQSNMSRLMGAVTDGSGGALPGVTVTVVVGNRPSTSVVTDGSGRYLTEWIAPGTYTITFVLSGFETRTVAKIPLGPGQTVVLDQQLPLASLNEVVEVTAPAPAPPPPPPAPRVYVKPPRPEPAPVDPELIASVCGPRQATDFSQALGKIVANQDHPGREMMGPGDHVRIDAGDNQGVKSGQNLVVRRRFQTGERFAPKKFATFAEQSAGLVQVLETEADASLAAVVYLCGELYAGDTVEPFIAQPAYFAIADGTPRYDEPAIITTGEHGASLAAGGHLMVIDHGIMQGVQRGQRLTIFRRPLGHDGPPITIGEGLIVSVRADSATIRIERVTDAVTVGDMVAVHR